MRYFTKEWYNDTMIADMCFQLRKNESASVFSERFFERLYTVEERAYVKYCKRNARVSKAQFDKNDAEREFASNYKENLDFVKANIPEEILADVKDVRVLALGTATNDIAMRITRFCGKKNRLCESTEREYNNASEEADERVGIAANIIISLPRSEILSLETNDENDTLLAFSNAETGLKKRLVLKDASLTESDSRFVGSTVIKHELLLTEDDQFEFSVLALGKDAELVTVSFIAKSIET